MKRDCRSGRFVLTHKVSGSTRTCTHCHKKKDLGAFSPRWDGKWGGLYPTCKACRRAALTTYRARHREAVLAKARLYARELYRRHAKHFGDKVKAWKHANPEKRTAQLRLKKALASGRVTRPDRCDACGTSARRIEAHHADYSRPLDVRWLCKPCHVAADRQRREKP